MEEEIKLVYRGVEYTKQYVWVPNKETTETLDDMYDEDHTSENKFLNGLPYTQRFGTGV